MKRFHLNEKLPKISLLDGHNREIHLEQFFGHPILLIFLRHLSWLSCQEHLVEVQRSLKEFQTLGVQIKVVSFAPPEKVKSYAEHFQWKFDVYSDPEREVYKLFGLARAPLWKIFHPKSVLHYSKLILQGKKVQKTTEDIQQMGGDFLIDSEGRLRFFYRSQRPDDRPSLTLLLEEITKLSQK